jgi:tetratricopeptide (TPR) repeat protein
VIMAGVFLSYRRVERAPVDRLARSLANRFGADLVFQDVEDIAGGQRWRDSIRTALQAAELVVAAIGPRWLVDDGRRRLDEPYDVLRAELLEALKLEKPIVPVLIGGAAMPTSQDIPEGLSDLAERQAVSLDDVTWNIDIERLLERVRSLIQPTRRSEPLPQIKDELGRLQSDVLGRLLRGDPAGALDTAQRTLATLDRISPLYPADVELQAIRGYTHKNCALALQELGRDREASEALDASDTGFTTLLEEYPDAPYAWDGKGSVLMIRGQLNESRGQLEESLRHFERALELDPGYWEPRQNRDAVVHLLEQRFR